MKLLGIVILYYPDDAVVKNIATYLAQLDELMLWDNTPATDRRELDLDSLGDGRGKIILDGCGENLGIGSALNKAVAYARANGFTHLLTLDQDSCFGGRNFESYLRAIRSYGEDKAAIFSTNYFIKSQQTTMYPPTDSVDEVYSAMTSGSIYPVSLFDTLGDFMESLFVWGVDCEFCWRAKRKDIPVLCFKNILLTHDLGYQKKKRRLLGKEVFPNEYGPARSYYNVRNGILLHRLYPEALNLKSHLRYHFYKRVVFIILYERQKFSKLWALLVDVLLCNVLIKNLVARTRPFDVNTAVQLLVAKPRDYSFPSGHTAASFASVTALYLAGEKKMWKAALVLAVLIALSRLYLYVHYPTDIIGGVVFGSLSGYLGYKIVEWIQKKKIK